MLTKIVADRYKPYRQCGLKKWLWFFFTVVPMGLVFTAIVLIVMKMDKKEKEE